MVLASGVKVGSLVKNIFLWCVSSRNKEQRTLNSTSSGVGLSALSFATNLGLRAYASKRMPLLSLTQNESFALYILISNSNSFPFLGSQ